MNWGDRHSRLRRLEAEAIVVLQEAVSELRNATRDGDNVSSRRAHTLWYGGPGPVSPKDGDDGHTRSGDPFRMPVQLVNRPNPDLRGIVGTIAGGSVRVGDEIVVAGSGHKTRVQKIVTAAGDSETAQAGDRVTLLLAEEVDITPDDLLASPKQRPQVADQFAAYVIWMSDEHLLPGRSYLMKTGARTVPASVTELKHRLDVETLVHQAAKTLESSEIGFCNLATTSAVAFDAYVDNRETGSFVLIDRYTNVTVAAGLIAFELRRATNIHLQDITVSKDARAALKAQRPIILWFTGLPGAGKSTIANLVEAQLHARGVHTSMLDGDNVRHGLNRDLGFTDVDRVENIRRVGEVAKLMTEAGLVVLCSFISPFRAERRMVRDLANEGDFIEVFVDTPLEECIARDPKGLYKRALAGEIKNFTGIDQAYEAPEHAEIHLQAGKAAPDALARIIVDELLARQIIQ